MRFLQFFGSKNALITKTWLPFLVLFNSKQLLFYDLPPKNASITLKLQFLDSQILQFSKFGYFESLKMP